MGSQHVHDGRRQGNRTLAPLSLGRLEPQTRSSLFERSLDPGGEGVKINLLPSQGEDLTSAHSRAGCEDGNRHQSGVALQGLQHGFDFTRL